MRTSSAAELEGSYMMAGITLVIAPTIILFFLTQRTFIEGIMVTGIKG